MVVAGAGAAGAGDGDSPRLRVAVTTAPACTVTPTVFRAAVPRARSVVPPVPAGEVRADDDVLRGRHADARGPGRRHGVVERVRFHAGAVQAAGQRIGGRTREGDRLAGVVPRVGEDELRDARRREGGPVAGDRVVAGQRDVGAVVAQRRRLAGVVQVHREDAAENVVIAGARRSSSDSNRSRVWLTARPLQAAVLHASIHVMLDSFFHRLLERVKNVMAIILSRGSAKNQKAINACAQTRAPGRRLGQVGPVTEIKAETFFSDRPVVCYLDDGLLSCVGPCSFMASIFFRQLAASSGLPQAS